MHEVNFLSSWLRVHVGGKAEEMEKKANGETNEEESMPLLRLSLILSRR